jgi:uncharacterized protein YecE (DUF72 family)
MNWWVGTSGYSYKEWKGTFYPEKIKPADMLSYYAERLNAVEINNTFYRLPKTDVVRAWGDQVGEEFRFILKASRRITHFARLGETSFEPLEYMLATSATLGDRLGCILFQLPPNMKVDVERLAAFLEHVPEGTRAAFEFRHDSWNDPAVHDALRARNAALCLADADDADEPAFVTTADWGYLRLRRADYDDEALSRWGERVKGSGWKDAHVFFKHEDEGAGPALAARFRELAGV